jgi:hypothetical protein
MLSSVFQRSRYPREVSTLSKDFSQISGKDARRGPGWDPKACYCMSRVTSGAATKQTPRDLRKKRTVCLDVAHTVHHRLSCLLRISVCRHTRFITFFREASIQSSNYQAAARARVRSRRPRCRAGWYSAGCLPGFEAWCLSLQRPTKRKNPRRHALDFG